MKLTKLMLSASIAALALVSCNKQDTTPELSNNRLKSIEISLKNVILTKGVVDTPVKDGDKIQVNNFQIFLLDGSGNEYTSEAKNSDGTAAQSYWDTALPTTASFHYLDPNCTKVVAVANMGGPHASYQALLDYLAAHPLAIGNQQDPTGLALYAEDSSFDPTGTHVDEGVDGEGNPIQYQNEVYKVELMLKPRISRFEVDGFSVIFQDPANPKYDEIKITQLAFQNYCSTSNLITGVEGTEVIAPITDFANQSAVYTWLDGIANPNTDWFRDAVDITITPAASVKDLPADGKLAYHAFAGDKVPVFVIKLEADGQPAYLYTKNLKDGTGTAITEFQEGYIYRMSGVGETGPGSDGTIEIPEEKIDPMDRCLDITVDVMSWEVALITPEF